MFCVYLRYKCLFNLNCLKGWLLSFTFLIFLSFCTLLSFVRNMLWLLGVIFGFYPTHLKFKLSPLFFFSIVGLLLPDLHKNFISPMKILCELCLFSKLNTFVYFMRTLSLMHSCIKWKAYGMWASYVVSFILIVNKKCTYYQLYITVEISTIFVKYQFSWILLLKWTTN